jgi:hypothetical protein
VSRAAFWRRKVATHFQQVRREHGLLSALASSLFFAVSAAQHAQSAPLQAEARPNGWGLRRRYRVGEIATKEYDGKLSVVRCVAAGDGDNALFEVLHSVPLPEEWQDDDDA